jgi:PAS domain S-box-containing protein
MNAVAKQGPTHAEHFALAQQALGFVTWIWNGVGDHAEFLGDLSPLLGLPAGTHSGRHADYRKSLHPDDVEASDRTLAECLVGFRPEYRTEERVIWPDGTVRWLETYGRATSYGPDGHAMGLSGVIRDVTERKQLEAAKAQSEEKFSKAFHACPDYMVISRLSDSSFLDVNPAFTRVTGYAAQEVIGHAAEEFGLWTSKVDMQKFRDALRTQGKVEDLETSFASRSGAVVRAKVSSAVTQMNGEMVAITVARDLTGLEDAQLRSRQSEHKFRAVFETSPEPVSITRLRDSRILDLNEACAQLIGLPRSTLVGRPTTDLAPYADPADRDRVLEILAGEGEVRNILTRRVRTDGTQMDLLESCRTVELEGETCIVWSWRDVTAMHGVQRALGESERRYRSLFDAALDYIFIMSPQGILVDINPSACKALGYARDEVVGTHFSRIVDPAAFNRMLPRVAEIVERRKIRGERTIQCKDGSAVAVEFAASPLPDGNVLAVVRDVSERKRAEADLEDLNTSLEQRVRERTAELEAANRELDSFSHSVSHDLRAPLFQINGFATLLRKDRTSSLSADAVRFLERIEHGADQMGQLLEALLEFSVAGRAALRRAPVDMQSLVGEVLLMLRGPESARANIRIGELPLIRGDATLLRQVWQNLLGNALKFSRHAETPRIEVGAERRGDAVEFFVRDNGAGFDMQESGRLFGVFERLHSAQEFEGSGAGLSIVKRIIERHGGRISATGEIGRGACLRFTLPE